MKSHGDTPATRLGGVDDVIVYERAGARSILIHTQASRGAFRVPVASEVLDGEELRRTTSRYRSTIHRTRARGALWTRAGHQAEGAVAPASPRSLTGRKGNTQLVVQLKRGHLVKRA